jgi:RND family efflux transporter MFP subunit
MAESPRNPNIRELESLRIARTAEPKQKRRLMPLAIIALIVAVLGVAGYQIYIRTLGSPPEVQTAFVTVKEKGQAGVLLTGSGYVVTRHKYISIGTVLLGKIVSEPIEEGQIVKKGDILARIDDRNYLGLYNQAVADRDLADANVKLDLAEAIRERALHKEGVTSQDELDTAENKLLVAQAALERAHASVASAKYYQDETVIRSPINGIVLKKYHEVGDTINYGAQAEAGAGVTDIAQLADTEDMRAEVDINESDISKVAIGTPAQVIPDSYPDMPFSANVVKIYPAADRQKGTVKVEVHILQPDLKIIKPEMSAKVSFLANGEQKAEQPLVLVPKKALVGDQSPAVWVVRDAMAERVPVTVGREFQEGVEVKQGLTGGEQVIVVPPPNLRDGMKVTPVAAS